MARERQKTGVKAKIARIKAQGWNAIDRRTSGYRASMRWRSELLDSLGGESNLSSQELMLAELCVRDRLLLDHCDVFIMQQDSIINRRRRSVYPIVSQRMQIADALGKRLAMLGLKKRSKILTLPGYLEEEYSGGSDAAPT